MKKISFSSLIFLLGMCAACQVAEVPINIDEALQGSDDFHP